eukprot:5598086-Prymnesium_polylepis.1
MKRLDVKRGARRHAFDSFDPEKVAAKQQNRRKRQQRAPAAMAADAAAVAQGCGPRCSHRRSRWIRLLLL